MAVFGQSTDTAIFLITYRNRQSRALTETTVQGQEQFFSAGRAQLIYINGLAGFIGS